MKRWMIPAALGFVTACLVGGALLTMQQKKLTGELSDFVDNQYQKSFYELVDHTGSIEDDISRLLISEDKDQNIKLLNKICLSANMAVEDLGEIPTAQDTYKATGRFLNQLGDYCRYLNIAVSQGVPLKDEDIEILTGLYDASRQLNESLTIMEERIQSGDATWRDLAHPASETEDIENLDGGIPLTWLGDIQDVDVNYPRLIYDGPFSEVMESRSQSYMKGSIIDKEQAVRKLADFIGSDRIDTIEDGPDAGGVVDTYGFRIKLKDYQELFYGAVTRQGGHIHMISGYVPTRDETISLDNAVIMAREFLISRGYNDMEPAYSDYHDGVATINFAYSQEGILIYPDLIKVRITLDTGDIVGWEAGNYIKRHRQRTLPQPSLSEAAAAALVSTRLSKDEGRLCIIPKQTGREVLCWEYKGRFGDDEFIVYINAMDGGEEDILKVINTGNGQMVVWRD